MDYRSAEFVRFISEDEDIHELIDEAKAETWTKEREHAVLVVEASPIAKFAMVRGGRDGILLHVQPTGELSVEIENGMVRVLRLAWHIHPWPTGPSDHDRNVLDLLGQDSSMLYEIGGPAGGTRFTRMSDRNV